MAEPTHTPPPTAALHAGMLDEERARSDSASWLIVALTVALLYGLTLSALSGGDDSAAETVPPATEPAAAVALQPGS